MMPDIGDGADGVVDERVDYVKFNKVKNHYYAAAAPSNPVAGVIRIDSDDERIYKYDGSAAWNLILASGCIPAVLAYNSSDDANATGDGTAVTVDLDTEVFDNEGDFAADVFTAPIDGKYQINGVVQCESVGAGHTTFLVEIVTSNRTYEFSMGGGNSIDAAGNVAISISALVDMDTNDTAFLRVTVSGGGKTVAVGGSATLKTFMSVHLAA